LRKGDFLLNTTLYKRLPSLRHASMLLAGIFEEERGRERR